MVISPIGNLKAAVVVGSGGTGVLADASRLTLLSPSLLNSHQFIVKNPILGARAPLTTEIPPSCTSSAAPAG